MDMRQRIADLAGEMLKAAFPEAQGLPEDLAALLEVPPDPAMGDYAFPCFKLSKALRMGPPMIAKKLSESVQRPDVARVECVGGYLNFFFNRENFARELMNAIMAAQHEHDFIYRGWEGRSAGNPHAHAILRGYVNRQGVTHPNYHYETLQYLASLFAKWSPQNPAVIIDCNHSNSGKNPFEQPRIMKEVLHSCPYDSDLKRLVKGFMVESYIEDGNQPVDGGVYGKSITDACLGWEKSERLIYEVAELL